MEELDQMIKKAREERAARKEWLGRLAEAARVLVGKAQEGEVEIFLSTEDETQWLKITPHYFETPNHRGGVVSLSQFVMEETVIRHLISAFLKGEGEVEVRFL